MDLFPKNWAQAINRGVRRVPTWPIYVIGVAWAGWLFYQGLTGALGPEPINTLERRYGLLALQIMVAVLAVTPLRTLTGISLLKFRRALGVTMFFFALAHFAVWAVLDLRDIGRIGVELTRRPYIMIGFAAFVLLLPLAITSNNTAVKRLGGMAWRKLHLLTYPAALLGALHYIWLVKGYPVEPFLYAGGIIGLLLMRVRWARLRTAAA